LSSNGQSGSSKGLNPGPVGDGDGGNHEFILTAVFRVLQFDAAFRATVLPTTIELSRSNWFEHNQFSRRLIKMR
jgi:hypothetical protein